MEALIVGFLFGQVVAYLVARRALNRWRRAASFQADTAVRAGVDAAAERTKVKLLERRLADRDGTIAALERYVHQLEAERASAIAGELAADVEVTNLRQQIAGLREQLEGMRGTLGISEASANG